MGNKLESHFDLWSSAQGFLTLFYSSSHVVEQEIILNYQTTYSLFFIWCDGVGVFQIGLSSRFI